MSLHVTQPTVVPLTTSASGQFVIRVTRSPAPDAGLRLFELEPGNYALHIDLRDVVLALELPDQGVTRFCNIAT